MKTFEKYLENKIDIEAFKSMIPETYFPKFIEAVNEYSKQCFKAGREQIPLMKDYKFHNFDEYLKSIDNELV